MRSKPVFCVSVEEDGPLENDAQREEESIESQRQPAEQQKREPNVSERVSANRLNREIHIKEREKETRLEND